MGVFFDLGWEEAGVGGGLIVLSEGEGIILKGAENEAGDEMLGAAGGLVKYAHGAIASGV